MKNTMLDGSLILNATVFHYDYTGYQVSKIVNRTSVNENIDAKIKGLELESIWEPINNLRFNASLGVLQTEIGEASSIDTFNRTQGNPSLVVIKASNASNCTASKAGVQGLMGLINAGALAPTTMLGVCSGAFTGAANPLKAFGIDIPFSDGISKNLKALARGHCNLRDWRYSRGLGWIPLEAGHKSSQRIIVIKGRICNRKIGFSTHWRAINIARRHLRRACIDCARCPKLNT
jgi:hypothetical protein